MITIEHTDIQIQYNTSSTCKLKKKKCLAL